VVARGNVLDFTRFHAGHGLRILLNMGTEPAEVEAAPGRVLLSTLPGGPAQADAGILRLRANEGVILAPEDAAG
jgi:hypothetical protein